MATKKPSYLKRQKEMKRAARAQEKREARRARKESKAPGISGFLSPQEPAADADENSATGS
jgi:hypothetical protein